METEDEDFVRSLLDDSRKVLHQKSNLLSEIAALEEKLNEIGHVLTHRGIVTQMQSGPWHAEQSDRDILTQFHLVDSQPFQDGQWSVEYAVGKVEEVMSHLESLQCRMIEEELNVYKRECQLAQIGFSKSDTKNLKDLQSLSERYANAHFLLENHIEIIRRHTTTDSSITAITNFQHKQNQLFLTLLSATFIVEQQPPQVMKIKTRFPKPVRLRFLLGPILSTRVGMKALASTSVKVSIISEPLAKDLVLNFCDQQHNFLKANTKPSGVLSNDRAKLDFVKKSATTATASHSASGAGDHFCYAEYRNLNLIKIDREIKKVKGSGSAQSPISQPTANPFPSVSGGASPTVADEKFALLFQMELKINLNCYHIWSLSMPLVVITHAVQESQAYATVLWDTCFSSPSRLPFQVTERVPWTPDLAEILSRKFFHATGRPLDDRQLLILKSKLMGQSPEEELVSFARFAREPMAGVSLNFWEWFHNCLKLIEKHALRSWRDEGIFGFIGREDAELLLKRSSPGTFLLRFSDSILGAISVCYVASNRNTYSLLPFTTKNLAFRNLADSIWDLDNLTTVYPNIPKEKAFPRPTHHSNPFHVSSTRQSSTEVDVTDINTRPKSGYVSSFPRIRIPDEFV